MELTCWWNQLWIIFMNMKSITAAAQSISFIPFVFSLRMRKQIENEMKLKGIAAQANEWVREEKTKFILFLMSERFHFARQQKRERLGWLFFLNGWVRGAAAPRQPAKREDKPSPARHFISSFLHLIEWKNEWNQIERKERELMGELVWLVCFLFFGGLWGGHRPMLRKEKRQAKQQAKSARLLLLFTLHETKQINFNLFDLWSEKSKWRDEIEE